MKTAGANPPSPIRTLRRVTAAVCLGLFLTLQLLAASRLLHHQVCTDAATPGHECVITLLAQGHFTAPVFGSVLILAALGFARPLPAVPPLLLSSFDPVLVPTRGPPCR